MLYELVKKQIWTNGEFCDEDNCPMHRADAYCRLFGEFLVGPENGDNISMRCEQCMEIFKEV